MGRIKKTQCWQVNFYENRSREGEPINTYLCNTVADITTKTGMGRGHIYQIKDGRINRCHYRIEIVDRPKRI